MQSHTYKARDSSKTRWLVNSLGLRGLCYVEGAGVGTFRGVTVVQGNSKAGERFIMSGRSGVVQR